MNRRWVRSLGLAIALVPATPFAQTFDITTFDVTATGPWSDVGNTTLMVPKVPNGSIKLDGAASSQEYGGFAGITVTPGTNAWILDFPADRAWDGPNDSSFTYWLAHDDTNFYVGVSVMDDIVNSDDPPASFWNDDAIEIVVDALADRLDNNTDASKDKVGGHSYINYKGRFSAWDDTANAIGSNSVWATGVDWKYGPTNDVYGVGQAVTGGWQLEVRFAKRLFQDTTAGNLVKNGYRMGFNIGIDDDDKHGPGLNGDKSRTQDLEIQYFWANRQRRIGYTSDYLAALSPEDKAAKVWLLDPNTDPRGLPLGIDSNGRLSHGGTGEIIFGYDANAQSAGKILFVTSSADSPINADPELITLFRAKGYTVTPFTSGVDPDAFRAAVAGQDVVFISESIGSTTVLDPLGDATGVFALKDTDIPVISYEAYMWDNADWVTRTADGSNDFSKWGNTARNDNDGMPNGVPSVIQDARDSLYILNASHPIAAGFPAGKLKVYNTPYSFNYGIPSPEADVIASVQADGSFPTLFVYEKGKKLSDGSVAPNRRIALFLGQAANPNANWPTDYADLSDAGRTLILNTVAYAISKAASSQPTLSVAMAGKNLVVITYSGGTLQSSGTVNGTWANETAPSPVTVQPTGAAKFYRVKGV